MKFHLPAAALASALSATGRVVERRNTVPILSNIKLVASGALLELTATDLDIEVRTSIAATVDVEGETTLPAAMLASIAAKLPKTSTAALERSADGNTIAISSGRSAWALQCLPTSDFPDMTTGAFPIRFMLAVKDLVRITSKLAFAISTEETRYYLNGIHFHPTEDHLVAVATDGHRLARINLPLPDGAARMPPIIVPRKTIGEIEKMARAAGDDDSATIDVSDTKIRISLGQATLTSKLIDGTFPDYRRVIPAANSLAATLPTEGFKAAIDRVSTISNERGRAVKLAFADGSVNLACSNPDTGSASEMIEGIEGLGDSSLSIGFNARYVAEALDRIESADTVMAMGDAATPAMLSEPGKAAEFLIVLMPMRV